MSYVLSIAGHDPSNGAGLGADIKTFTELKMPSLTVCTANTVQNDWQFDNLTWLSIADINAQLNVLLPHYTIQAIKIGLVPSFQGIIDILDTIEYHFSETHQPQPFVLWDPILSASAGFRFHDPDHHVLKDIGQRVQLITPNVREFEALFPRMDWRKAKNSPVKSAILVKGGHANGFYSSDVLLNHQAPEVFRKKRLNASFHGSGCVLSAAIVAYIAQGFTLQEAIKKAKKVVYKKLERVQK